MILQPQTVDEFRERVKAGTVIVVFVATWCGPSKLIGPYFEELSKTYTEIVYLKVDVDELEEIVNESRICAMPTFLVYKHGKVIDQMLGASKEKLEQLVRKYNLVIL